METSKVKICERCGNSYEPTGRNQKVCANCKYANDLERMQNYGKALRVGGPGSGGNQKGTKNHQWKGGVASFKTLKLESLAGEYYCERCGKDLRGRVAAKQKGWWAVHHRDQDRSNNSLENLELLCKRCHQIEHECWKNYNGKV